MLKTASAAVRPWSTTRPLQGWRACARRPRQRRLVDIFYDDTGESIMRLGSEQAAQ
jgi:hypothetical protein